MKALKLSVLFTLAAALCASATDYTPLTISVSCTSVSNNIAKATAVTGPTLLAKVNAYLGIQGAKLVIDNTNGHVVVLNGAGAPLVDLSSDNAYYTNKYGIMTFVYASTAPWQASSVVEFIGGFANPDAGVLTKVNVALRLPSDTFYIYFQTLYPYYGWYTDFQMGTWGGPQGSLLVSRTAAGAYTQNYNGTISGWFSGYNPYSSSFGGHTSGSFSAIGTSTCPWSIWDTRSY